MDSKLRNHYATYLKIYGAFIVEAANDDDFVDRLIKGDDLSPLEYGLRHLIQTATCYE